MADERPTFTHQPRKHGLIGPFSGRQLGLAVLAIAVAAVVLVAVTTPLGSTGLGPGVVDPRATPYLIGTPTEGLAPGSLAPELEATLDDGTTYRLHDLDGNPIRLADLRGKVVWINFFASWCPPCQQETPILRELSDRYRDQGLEVIGISVQETSPDDLSAYAERYDLEYPIGFDASGHIFRLYRAYALPTQFFIDPNGVIVTVVNGPVDEAGASALIESLLPEGAASPDASGRPAPSPSRTP